MSMGSNSCFVFCRSRIQISVRRQTETFRSFLQSLHANSGIVPYIRPLSSSFQFIIHISYFHSLPYNLSTESVVKQTTNKIHMHRKEELKWM
jgi:hypothetical protein